MSAIEQQLSTDIPFACSRTAFEGGVKAQQLREERRLAVLLPLSSSRW